MPTPRPTPEIEGPAFGELLAAYRTRMRPSLSQSRLAERADYDHSYISRLEAGHRVPTRDAVLQLGGALECSAQELDALLLSAGYAPESQRQLIVTVLREPCALALLAALRDDALPGAAKDGIRQSVTSLLETVRATVAMQPSLR